MINVSNHPSEKWSEAQLQAAQELDGRTVIDVPFPNVDPTWDTKRICVEAEDLAGFIRNVARGGSRYVMVQGEFSLTYNLVRELRDAYFVPVCATTERVCNENPDGTRTYTFKFVQFREY
jgi:hypothetical protein